MKISVEALEDSGKFEFFTAHCDRLALCEIAGKDWASSHFPRIAAKLDDSGEPVEVWGVDEEEGFAYKIYSKDERNLFAHQIQAKHFILRRGGVGALFHDMGLGKTLTNIEIFKSLRQESNHELKLFVVCPLGLIEGAWGDDIKKFSDLSYINLNDHLKKTKQLPPREYDVYIINYESLISQRNVEPINALLRSFEFMAVLDESSKIKNPNSQITKRILYIRNFFKFKTIASGTPAPNDETEFWPQIRFLRDDVFNSSFTAFKSEYFTLERGDKNIDRAWLIKLMVQRRIYHKYKDSLDKYQDINDFIRRSREVSRIIFEHGFKYVLNPAKKDEFTAKLASICHYAKKSECLDLPPIVNEVRKIDMKDNMKYYRDMESHLISIINREAIVGDTALKKIMKLRQITAGFAIDEDERVHELPKNPKLKELFEVVEEIGNNQAIIWCQFHYEIEKILDALDGRATTLYGKTKDKESSREDFKSGKYQFLIAHPRSAGHGHTFINCNIEIFYSMDYSAEYYQQAAERTNRPGQTRRCTNVHLLCKDTIDEEIFDVLTRKRDKAEIIYKRVKSQAGRDQLV